MAYINRNLESSLKKYLKVFPAVGLTGPRQSGKSTMLKTILASSYEYVTFDDYEMVRSFQDDPKGFFNKYSDRVVFDEVQKVPDLFHYIKLQIDNDRRRYGKYILTGSSQFVFMKSITESLAGRIGLLTLLPFQRNEIPVSSQDRSTYYWCYPEQVVNKFKENISWYSAYIETYLSRDVRDLSNIGQLREFRRCLFLLATRTSQILDLSTLAHDLGVAVNTVKKWISVLEASYIIFLLPPFYNNLGKRIVKSPKVYFFDTGLVSFLTGIKDEDTFIKSPIYGAIYENYIVAEIYKNIIHSRSDNELFYYRTSNGVEVDLIIDQKTSKEFLEIKASKKYQPDMVESIIKIKKKYEKGILIYRGKDFNPEQNLFCKNASQYLRFSKDE